MGSQPTSEAYQALVRSLELQVTLTSIVARGGGVERLLTGWQEHTGEPIAVFHRLGRPVGRSGGFPSEVLDTVAGQLESTAAPRIGEVMHVIEHGIEVTPFAGNDVVRGFVARIPSGTEAAELAAPTMRSLLALEYERHWYLDDPARRARATQLNRVLSLGDDAAVRARLRGVGMDPAELRGVAIEARTTTHAEVLVDDLVVVLGTPLIRQRERLVECLVGADPRRRLSEYGLNAPLGIGAAVAPRHAARTMQQAGLALETSRRVGSPIEYVDGASHEFLIRAAPVEYLESFADATLTPIETARGGEALLQTLHLWLIERRSVDATADRLGVHRHTVRNRLQRIAQLTGHDIEAIDAQTELWLALKARGIRGADPS
ncbi:PucR family transcriptional regulator [Microlunatus ginsengisoli]|uniref:PucR family transcriptional regulator n=1 Tax=Microlunatus ginsengisoli TaxID=363863 RepID=UPI0031D645AD